MAEIPAAIVPGVQVGPIFTLQWPTIVTSLQSMIMTTAHFIHPLGQRYKLVRVKGFLVLRCNYLSLCSLVESAWLYSDLFKSVTLVDIE